MWILATLVRIVFQFIEFLLWTVWAVIRFLARLLGLAEWQKVTTGEEYEYFAAHYLERQGFRILGYTRRTGDLGVDILAKKGIFCEIFTVSTRLSADSAHYAAKAEALGVPARP